MLIPETIYYLCHLLKKQRDLRRQRTLPKKVISIGNITVGGTGKTPAVIALAQEAKKRGYFPIILTRGYKGTIKGPCFVSKGDGPLLSPEEAGDEAFLMAQRLEGIPVIKSADRYEGGCLALNDFSGADKMIFILDDGYQHLRLFRDIDILLIDGMNPFGNRRLLPMGRLREPLKEMKRADLIVITRTSKMPETLLKEIRIYNDKAPTFLSVNSPSFFKTMNSNVIPLKDLSGKSAVAFCGLGNPESFRKSLIDLNVDLKDFIAFRDHHRFTPHDFKRIEKSAERFKADWIIATEKDIIKIRNFDLIPNLIYLSIEFEVEDNFFEEVFRRL